MIACAPGRRQSCGSAFQWRQVMPRLVAMFTVEGPQLPPGSRKYLIGAAGTIAWIASVVLCSSDRICSVGRLRRLRSWVHVWLHSVCPSATIRRTCSAYAATCWPMRQNVALTWYCARRSRTWLVYPDGPSSKVSARPELPVPVSDPNGPCPDPVPPEVPGDGLPEPVGTWGPAGLAARPGLLGDGGSDGDGAGSGWVAPSSACAAGPLGAAAARCTGAAPACAEPQPLSARTSTAAASVAGRRHTIRGLPGVGVQAGGRPTFSKGTPGAQAHPGG